MRRFGLCAVLGACALTLLSPQVHAASRGQYGGTLRVAVAGEREQRDPLLADSPQDAAMLALVARAVCRLDAEQGVVPVLAQSLTREGPLALRLSLRPGLRAGDGRTPLTAQQVAHSWMRLQQSETQSPYRALLFPLRGEGRYLAPSATSTLPLTLAFPWPDLERTLCHPALTVVHTNAQRVPQTGAGPFLSTRAPGVFMANWNHPGGRPYVDRLSVTSGDVRAVQRVLELGDAEVGLGATRAGMNVLPAPPALFATWLAFQPERTGATFRSNVESLIDRGDLTRIFVRAPSTAMSSLLPPALMPQQPPPSKAVSGPVPSRPLTLLYDLSLPDQKSVAERIQVKLHDGGYKIVLRGVSRKALRAAWANGEFDLMLHALLLPPVAGPALAVALDAAGRHDLLARELPAIGAIADDKARDAHARERAQALLPELPLIPLYAQSLRVATTQQIAGLKFDAHGIPLLDGAFLVPQTSTPPPEGR